MTTSLNFEEFIHDAWWQSLKQQSGGVITESQHLSTNGRSQSKSCSVNDRGREGDPKSLKPVLNHRLLIFWSWNHTFIVQSFWRAWSGNYSRHHYFLYVPTSKTHCRKLPSCAFWHEWEALIKQWLFSFIFMLTHCWIQHKSCAATVSAMWILSCKWPECTCCLSVANGKRGQSPFHHSAKF